MAHMEHGCFVSVDSERGVSFFVGKNKHHDHHEQCCVLLFEVEGNKCIEMVKVENVNRNGNSCLNMFLLLVPFLPMATKWKRITELLERR